MGASTCLGTTRSRCRRLPRAASCGHCEPQVNRDPADTYCRAAVDSRHRTSPFGCPDRASDHRPPTLRRRSPIRTACLEADCRSTAVGPGSAKKSSSGTGFSNPMLSGTVIRARPIWGWPRVWLCLAKRTRSRDKGTAWPQSGSASCFRTVASDENRTCTRTHFGRLASSFSSCSIRFCNEPMRELRAPTFRNTALSAGASSVLP